MFPGPCLISSLSIILMQGENRSDYHVPKDYYLVGAVEANQELVASFSCAHGNVVVLKSKISAYLLLPRAAF